MVVKIGGSLAATADLSAWLAAFEAASGEIVIVPGGGVFADAVREAQATMGFDDATAHHLALLAMDQYGRVLCGRSARLVMAQTLGAMHRAWRMKQIPVWAPLHMAERAAVPASWDATSDTLAAWLAQTVRAGRLLLVKSADVTQSQGAAPTLAELAAQGLSDALFPRFAAMSGAEIYVAGPAALPDAMALLAAGGIPGTRIALS